MRDKQFSMIDNKYRPTKKKPSMIDTSKFVEIHNLYEQLNELISNYGIENIIFHLGKILEKDISRKVAERIWNSVNLYVK